MAEISQVAGAVSRLQPGPRPPESWGRDSRPLVGPQSITQWKQGPFPNTFGPGRWGRQEPRTFPNGPGA